MIRVLFAAAFACTLCTPDGRMAVLAKVGAKSFDALAAPSRTLIRAMAVGPDGAAALVVTFIRDGDGSARVDAADGRMMTAAVGSRVFTRAARAADDVRDEQNGLACGGRTYSVQRREGLGAMTAIQGRACHGQVERRAGMIASLALASLPACNAAGGAGPFDRLAACLRAKRF